MNNSVLLCCESGKKEALFGVYGNVSTGFAGCCCHLVVKSWLLQELLNNSGLTAVELLAKALAKAVGYTEVKKRSLLTSMENYVTLLLEGGKPMFIPSFAFGTLRRFIPEDKVDGVQGLALTADGQGAVLNCGLLWHIMKMCTCCCLLH